MPTLSLQTIKCMMLDGGFYNSMNIDPMAYHGYRENIPNLTDVIEEIDTEILLRPEFSDKLLDFRSSIKSRLDKLEAERMEHMPSVRA